MKERLNTFEEPNGQLAFDFDDDCESFIEQVQRILADQRQELRDIDRKERELKERQGDLLAERREVIKGIMKSEQVLERYGRRS